MEILDMLDWLLAALIVLGATETVAVTGILASEVAGTAWSRSPGYDDLDRDLRRSVQLEAAACFLGQVFVGTVSPYLVILLAANAAPWVASFASTMLVISGVVGGLALGLAFLAGLTWPNLAAPRRQTTDGRWDPVLVQALAQGPSRLPDLSGAVWERRPRAMIGADT